MSFLDVIHIYFEPYVTLEDRPHLETNSVFGREWDMTLEYVLHQPGLNAAYTSSLSAENDVWVLLVWNSEDDRLHFYKQTTGFGFVSNHMVKPPSVFLFGDGSYEGLETTRGWTVVVVTSENGDVKGLNHENGYLFVAKQDKDVVAQLYDGNDFDHATIAFMKSVDLREKDLRNDVQWKKYVFELHKCEQSPYPKSTIVDAPANIAELIGKQPWEYGLLSPDDSKYSDAAYPMSLSFRPMSTLGMADKFQPDSSDQPNMAVEVTREYAVCIIELAKSLCYVSSGEKFIRDLRRTAKLEDGAVGLEELSVLEDPKHPDRITFLTVWQGTSHFKKWRNSVDSICDSRWPLWTSSSPGLPKLSWKEMPLTADKQSWQQVDKILEKVIFTFEDPLTSEEQEAFEGRIQGLINTMSSCWSGDVDPTPVVYAEEPIWIDPQGESPQCLLFLAWDGVEQRAAWLGNFMAQDFTWAGHIAHALGQICCEVQSINYKMEKIYSDNSGSSDPPNEQVLDEGEDSDRDMGF